MSDREALPGQSSIVYLAPVRNTRNTGDSRHVVDDIHYPPVADPDAPFILVALQLFASSRPWLAGERLDSLEDAGQRVVRQRFEFLSRSRLYLD